MGKGGFIEERKKGAKPMTNRVRATFEYIGAALPTDEARAVWTATAFPSLDIRRVE
jgi:hypothetical protein